MPVATGPLRSITLTLGAPASTAPGEDRSRIDAHQIHHIVDEHVLVRSVGVATSWTERDRRRRAVQVEDIGVGGERCPPQLVLLADAVEGGRERGEKRMSGVRRATRQ